MFFIDKTLKKLWSKKLHNKKTPENPQKTKKNKNRKTRSQSMLSFLCSPEEEAK